MKALVLSVLLLAGCGASSRIALDSQPVPKVELSRYMGKWYEIARYPQRFEKDCHGVTAEYALRPDGKVSVLNTCRKGSLSGEARSAGATAWAVDGSNARFKVRFFWPFTGPYWIVDLDPEYRWALVGHPKREYFWILSRTPRLAPDLEAQVMAKVVELGYDPARLERGDQP